MKHLIQINGHNLPIREYKRQRVVTFEDIDTLHERAKGTAKRNFNRNAERFTEGKHFFNLPYDEVRSTNFVPRPNSQGLILITEKGYPLLVKSLNDDTAWKVQEQLIDRYFRYKETLRKAQADPNWQGARYDSKTSRLKESEELKQLVEYAKANGSRNGDRYYKSYTSMVNDAVGLKSGERDLASPEALQIIAVLETTVCRTIAEELEKETEYHEIYNLCKRKVADVMAVIYQPQKRLLLEESEGGRHGTPVLQ